MNKAHLFQINTFLKVDGHLPSYFILTDRPAEVTVFMWRLL